MRTPFLVAGILGALLPAAVGATDAVLCYDARSTATTTPAAARTLDVTDVVDGPRSLALGRAERLCVPVDLGTGVTHPAVGLRAYKATRLRGSPALSGDVDVAVSSVVGAVRLDRRAKATSLLVPAGFDIASPPNPPSFASHPVDHYRCDTSRPTPGRSFPTGSRLTLTDGLDGTAVAEILRPTSLCTPVDALGHVIKDTATTLACFRIRRLPALAPSRSIHVADALSAATIAPGRAAELCVPARAIARCNGHATLCDRPFDAVAYATTHNAMSNAEDGWLVPNQRFRIRRQLDDGVRALMLDTWYFGGDAVLCHGGDVFPCDLSGMTPLDVGLGEIESFLARQPDEVVSIIFESYVAEADTAADMAASGLLARAHVQVPGAPWPTLRTLLETGKRLVVFTDQSSATLPWHHYVWAHAWETHFSAETPADFTCAKNRGSLANPLFILNHFLTQFVGSPALAEQVNHDPFFLDRALECQAQSGRLPNFVTVDYYDIGDVLGVVNTLNAIP